MSQTIAPRFCVQCGVKSMPEARFCVECGVPIAGGARRAPIRFPLGRWAPVIVLLVIAGVGAVTVWLGSQSARPPAVVPPRQQAAAPAALPPAAQPPADGQQQPLPEGHPPLSLPPDVTQKIDQMAAAAKSKPDDLEVWRQLGAVQYRAGQFEPRYLDDAAASFQHILDKQPDDADAVRGLGNVAYDREQPQKAIEYYRKYLTARPGDLHVLTDLGTMYLSAKDLPKAVETYEQVLATDPKFFQAQFNLAIAQRALGEMPKAVESLKKSREIAPDDATRKQVDDLLAHVSGAPPAPAGAPAANPPSAPVAAAQGGGDVKVAIESIFRNHPIVGSKLDRFEWPDPHTVKVIIRQFPMESMPQFAKDMFFQRIKTGVKEKKAQYGITQPVRVELVDSATDKTMDTVTE